MTCIQQANQPLCEDKLYCIKTQRQKTRTLNLVIGCSMFCLVIGWWSPRTRHKAVINLFPSHSIVVAELNCAVEGSRQILSLQSGPCSWSLKTQSCPAKNLPLFLSLPSIFTLLSHLTDTTNNLLTHSASPTAIPLIHYSSRAN